MIKKYLLEITPKLTDKKPNRVISIDYLEPQRYTFFAKDFENVCEKIEEYYCNLKQNTRDIDYKISKFYEVNSKEYKNNYNLEKIIVKLFEKEVI